MTGSLIGFLIVIVLAILFDVIDSLRTPTKKEVQNLRDLVNKLEEIELERKKVLREQALKN